MKQQQQLQLQLQLQTVAAAIRSSGTAMVLAVSNASARVNALMKLLLLPDIISSPCIEILARPNIGHRNYDESIISIQTAIRRLRVTFTSSRKLRRTCHRSNVRDSRSLPLSLLNYGHEIATKLGEIPIISTL